MNMGRLIIASAFIASFNIAIAYEQPHADCDLYCARQHKANNICTQQTPHCLAKIKNCRQANIGACREEIAHCIKTMNDNNCLADIHTCIQNCVKGKRSGKGT